MAHASLLGLPSFGFEFPRSKDLGNGSPLLDSRIGKLCWLDDQVEMNCRPQVVSPLRRWRARNAFHHHSSEIRSAPDVGDPNTLLLIALVSPSQH